MSKHVGSAVLATILVAVLAGGVQVRAIAPDPVASDDGGFSPLFARRLEVGIRNMDKAPERVYMARLPLMLEDPLGTPFSGNPASACVGSACYLSYCLGSACIGSRCLGSACITSACGGSSCVASACGGSACIGSGCGGSACVGSGCLGSACLKCDTFERKIPLERG
jgi:hypothetical protein